MNSHFPYTNILDYFLERKWGNIKCTKDKTFIRKNLNHLYSSSRAGITECHGLGDLNEEMFHSSGGWKSKTWMLAGLVF